MSDPFSCPACQSTMMLHRLSYRCTNAQCGACADVGVAPPSRSHDDAVQLSLAELDVLRQICNHANPRRYAPILGKKQSEVTVILCRLALKLSRCMEALTRAPAEEVPISSSDIEMERIRITAELRDGQLSPEEAERQLRTLAVQEDAP